jgi:Protein similar to CwfJ C-terminus 2
MYKRSSSQNIGHGRHKNKIILSNFQWNMESLFYLFIYLSLQAIDEAEDEWAQHNAKKLIPTSGNLRQVIPPNFAYFHVEFGLDRGFVHVIDDEANFHSGFGLNVIRGMLQLPEEDMHRKRRYETVDRQKQAVVSFARDWEPFDWTRQLD